MRVLLVEDEPEMAEALHAALHSHDIVLDHVATLAEAEEALADPLHDVVLLDRQLPDGDGLSLLAKLRGTARTGAGNVPVIMLTARGDMADRVAGLDAGADDYIAKPFAVEELLARLRAVLRRPSTLAPQMVQAGRLSFDQVHREASIDGRRLDLPRRELLVLETLLRRLGRTVMRAALEEAVYGFADEVQSNALDAHISRLRRKLSEVGAGVEIHGIRGVGYLLRAAA
ncbi:response regulator transcription factor [Aquabacter sp. CN5-332]|uniref:response regulator transcription factor n=1 Tax=Aquabacter sp. CN5-332 TaxID=3156608 RepID=UPI0032B3A82F